MTLEKKIEGRQFLYCIIILFIYYITYLIFNERPLSIKYSALIIVSAIINIFLFIGSLSQHRKTNDYSSSLDSRRDIIDKQFEDKYYDEYIMVLPRILTLPFIFYNFIKILSYIKDQIISWFDTNLTIKIK